MNRLQRLAVTVLAAAALFGSTATTALAATTPYTDPDAVGVLTLCNADGQPMTSGSTADAPFVWRVVSSQAAQSPYDGPGRTATLFAYQPREQVWSSEWSGYQLTASATYSNVDHPMAQATRLDGTLGEFLDTFPASWDGYVQLRLYLGAPQEPPYTLKYATADLQVSGDTWTLVRGGTQGCTSGTAVSLERVLHPNRPQPGASTTASSRPSSAQPTQSRSPAAAGTGSGPGSGQSSSAADQASATSGSSSAAPAVFGAVALVAAFVAGIVLVTRRSRNSPMTAPPKGPAR